MSTTSAENTNPTTENPVQTTETPTKRASAKTYRKETIAKRLQIVKKGADNLTASAELNAAMGIYGYTSEKTAVLTALYNEAIAANSSQQKEFGEKSGAYAEFDQLYKTAAADYFNAVKIARVALKNNQDLLKILGADQVKKQTISGLFDQMQTFFDNVLSNTAAQQSLAGFGYNADRLAGLNKNYLTARAAYSRFYKEDAEAIAATKTRDEKIDALDEFYSDLLTIAKVALTGKKELMGLLY